MLLKQPEDSNLNLPVWDPRVSIKSIDYYQIFLMLNALPCLCLYVYFVRGTHNVASIALSRMKEFAGV